MDSCQAKEYSGQAKEE